jgi:hypothetical protein
MTDLIIMLLKTATSTIAMNLGYYIAELGVLYPIYYYSFDHSLLVSFLFENPLTSAIFKYEITQVILKDRTSSITDKVELVTKLYSKNSTMTAKVDFLNNYLKLKKLTVFDILKNRPTTSKIVTEYKSQEAWTLAIERARIENKVPVMYGDNVIFIHRPPNPDSIQQPPVFINEIAPTTPTIPPTTPPTSFPTTPPTSPTSSSQSVLPTNEILPPNETVEQLLEKERQRKIMITLGFYVLAAVVGGLAAVFFGGGPSPSDPEPM